MRHLKIGIYNFPPSSLWCAVHSFIPHSLSFFVIAIKKHETRRWVDQRQFNGSSWGVVSTTTTPPKWKIIKNSRSSQNKDEKEKEKRGRKGKLFVCDKKIKSTTKKRERRKKTFPELLPTSSSLETKCPQLLSVEREWEGKFIILRKRVVGVIKSEKRATRGEGKKKNY